MFHISVKIFEDKINFSVEEYEKRGIRKVKENEIVLPVSFSIGDKLCYIKKIMSVIIEQYDIETYNMEMDSDIGIDIIDAVKVEGIFQELFSNKGVVLWK